MTREELLTQGWELTYSGLYLGKEWVVHLKHTSRRTVHGYGTDEGAAINNAVQAIQRPLEDTKE